MTSRRGGVTIMEVADCELPDSSTSVEMSVTRESP